MPISEHPSFVWPQDKDIKIWRYLSLTKFISLLLTRGLFFSRGNLLGDPFEGSLTVVNIATRGYILKNKDTDERLVKWRNLNTDQLKRMFEVDENINRQSLRECFVNCWHMNEHESAAMWRLYSQSDESVCIQSRFSTLAENLPGYVNVGIVRYIDYERDVISTDNLFNAVLCKRKSFEHERELRAIAWERLSGELGGEEIRNNMTEAGLSVAVDLDNILEGIYINPTANNLFADVVGQIVDLHGLRAPIKKSKLTDKPLF